jgi:phosphoribosyl-AMP cyclohydrolase / phosphoribosyl-ATP pyrophosphohydrolase
MKIDWINDIDFEKSNGLIPAVIQDNDTREVLMLGYMNLEALEKTLETEKVTFFSRSKNRLWTKGEESGNLLHLTAIELDCDKDTLLIQVNPIGPTCHTGTTTCWGERNPTSFGILRDLEHIIKDRKENPENKESYVASLFAKGINKIAQKVGEEAVEVVIEAKDDNEELFLNESADLLFHYLILLQAKGYRLEDVLGVLEERRK